ncbi:hypothetical protein ACI3PL_20640, partial [Lacticaseibacillus paracasei]
MRAAPILASRGFPTHASGAERIAGRSTALSPDEQVQLTATEAAALNRDEWADVDDKLYRWLESSYRLATSGHCLISR